MPPNGESTLANSIKTISESFGSICCLSNLKSLSFAIASEVSAYDNENETAIALLGDARSIRDQYASSSKSDYTIFPMAFSQSASNWQSIDVPRFYRSFFEQLEADLNRDNNISSGLPPIEFNSFQGYSTMKQQIRTSRNDLAFGHSIYTGAYCIEPSMLSKAELQKQRQLLNQTESHQPFNETE